jgi:(1->4)-alpha-D-glucan 1-alpha-D-glucosylmutase
VVDHSRVSADLGGEEAHARLCAALGRAGLGQVLDVVPNHMAIAGRRNRWWWDVLRHGRESRYATFFDVSWDPPAAKLRGKILAPVLGDHYGRELEAGRLRVERDDGSLVVRYFEHEFPIDPLTYEGEDVDRLNEDPDLLDRLLSRQHYRLARWQVAQDELDYRRFFDVNSLVALRMEEPEVFRRTHELVLSWLRQGLLDGLRVDHPDGLRDPLDYFRRLNAEAPAAWLVAEKILEPGERLPDDWPVAGTTGYDFLNLVLGVLIDPEAEQPLTAVYRSFTGEDAPWPEVAHECRLLVMEQILGSDLQRLAALFERVCEGDRRHRDYTRRELLDCLREVIACLPAYRTYARPGLHAAVSDADRATVMRAVSEAAGRRPDLDPALLAFLARILLLEAEGEGTEELVWRFQQTSGPVAAKGVEDTAFYRYHRLVALNDVGGDPARLGVSPADFHAACAEAAAARPRAMLTTATHDTKRGEDVRARLAALTELPEAWEAAVRRWSEMNRRHRTGDLPDRNTEYLLYQTLVGAWPVSPDRLWAYLEKAVREAKVHTSWLAPDAGYEEAVRGFALGVLEDPEFLGDLEEFLGPVVEMGYVSSLAQKLLCLTAPGVPDVYQGTELWDLSLVDPDNRRPVDYAHRERLLDELEALGPRAAEVAWERRAEGLPKLLLVWRALCLRAERPELFDGAGYRPLAARGPRARHLLAFERGGGAAVVVPRLPGGLAGDWGPTTVGLPQGWWVDRLTGGSLDGGEVSALELLAGFPVALLERVRA